jgi:hypothetical protein
MRSLVSEYHGGNRRPRCSFKWPRLPDYAESDMRQRARSAALMRPPSIEARDVDNIYAVPEAYSTEGLDAEVLAALERRWPIRPSTAGMLTLSRAAAN